MAIGVIAGNPYTFYDEHKEYQEAIIKGIKNGQKQVTEIANKYGKKSKWLGFNFYRRLFWAKRAIYVNSPVEAYYPSISVDENGHQLNGENTYSITFPHDNLPPAKCFWSLMMYDNNSKLMVHNSINRYSIGDRTKGLEYNNDGSLTLHFSKHKPEQNVSNWLPAPGSDFYMLMRLYGPLDKVLKNQWEPAAILKIEK